MNQIEKVRAAVDYIECHLDKGTDLDEVAAALHYSKYHLHRAFSAAVGITIHEYQQRRRLTEAAGQLIDSDRSILDIALSSGYESQQAFSAVFKDMYKLPPRKFRERAVFYPLQLKFDFRGDFSLLHGSHADLLSRIRPAGREDIACWMELVRLVVDGFPFLQEEDYIETLTERIGREQAYILKDGEIAVGIMLFCNHTGHLDFFGIHPLYHKKGVGQAFLEKAMELLQPGNESISITTYRAGDKADSRYRQLLSELGFTEAELLIEYGYPTQQFVLAKQNFFHC